MTRRTLGWLLALALVAALVVQGLELRPRWATYVQDRQAIRQLAAEALTLRQAASHAPPSPAPILSDPPPLYSKGNSGQAPSQLESDLLSELRRTIQATGAQVRSLRPLASAVQSPSLPGTAMQPCRLVVAGNYAQLRRLILGMTAPPWLMRMDAVQLERRPGSSEHLELRMDITVYWEGST